MRASGSHDVTFEDVRVPVGSLIPGGPWGGFDEAGADMTLSFNFSLPVCFLGIAEAARDLAVELAMRPKGPKGKRLADRIPVQQLIAEIEMDLAVARAMVERTGRQFESYFERTPPGGATEGEGFGMLKEQQVMKYVVQRKAIDIVDRAMTATGGSAYMSKSPLSRLYRDVRAGPFMQPYAPYEALEYIGKVTLGLNPQLDR
jgi:alkylation response protein AidB-like acyl-CoA dehydrogenase